jgi:hypothetical protein
MLINPYRLANFSIISGLFDQAGPIPMPSNVDLRLRSKMKSYCPQLLLAGLFSFMVVSNASAIQMQHSAATPANQTAAQAISHPVENPWPNLISLDTSTSGPLLAQGDRYWHDGRWHSRKEEMRRAHWRREQARKEAERRREWERHHPRATHHYHR